MRPINSAGCVSQSSQCLNFMAITFLLVLAVTTATSSVVGPSRTNPSFSLEDNTIDPSSELLQIQPAEELLYPPKSSSFHVIDSNECITITMDEGVFHFKSRGGRNQVCGLYFVADPDKIISITVEYIDVRCDQKGLISIVDGWELSGQVFPSTEDHEKSLQERFTDLCVEPQRVEKLRRNFILSQNAGLIQYRVPTYGQGFSVRVHHINNPRPCNILVQDLEAIYKLENFGREINCSLTTLFDAKIRVLQVITGLHGPQVKFPSHSTRIHTSELYHKCRKMGLHDYIQIGGSSGLDTSKMEVIEEFCGYHSHPMNRFTTVFCGMTTLRLVSSGKYHNKLVAEVRRAVIEDIESANYICDIPMK